MSFEKIFRNTAAGMISQAVLLVFGFISQRVMNLYMGAELVGMNGVISNIIAVLSVTELGLSVAIGYHLYGALVEQDKLRIASLMRFYRNTYTAMAAVIGGAGLVLLPWVHLFMKHGSYSLGYVRALYLLWLLRTVLSYPLTYKRALLVADQRGYLIGIWTILSNVLNYSIIALVVSQTQRYLLALALNVVVETLLSLAINAYIDQQYPYLNNGKTLQIRELLPTLKRDIKNTFVAKVSNNLLRCTDNLLISSFISVTAVGLYNNYFLVTHSISNILTELAGAIQPSVGHMLVKADYENDYHVLRQITFVFFCIVTVAACGMVTLIDPFITDLWLDDSFRMEAPVVWLCIAVTVVQGMGLPLSIMLGVSGLFEQEKRLSVLIAVANMAVSLALVVPLGIAGVLCGTVLSYAIQLFYRLYVFFAEYTRRNAGRYLRDLMEYMILLLAEIRLAGWAVSYVYHGTIGTFIASILVCVFLPTAVNLLIYSRSWRLKSLLQVIRQQKYHTARKESSV